MGLESETSPRIGDAIINSDVGYQVREAAILSSDATG